MKLQVGNSRRLVPRKIGQQREVTREGRKALAHEGFGLSWLSILGFIPPLMEEECTRLPMVLRVILTPSMLSPVSQELEIWEYISWIPCQQHSSLKSTNLGSCLIQKAEENQRPALLLQ